MMVLRQRTIQHEEHTMVQRYARQWPQIEQTALRVDRAVRGQAPLRYETQDDRLSLVAFANYLAEGNSFPITVDGQVAHQWNAVGTDYVEFVVARTRCWLTATEFVRALSGIRDLTSEEVHEGPAPRQTLVSAAPAAGDPWA